MKTNKFCWRCGKKCKEPKFNWGIPLIEEGSNHHFVVCCKVALCNKCFEEFRDFWTAKSCVNRFEQEEYNPIFKHDT
jgi:hypothetical protein